ncbi:(2Fe-2S) ferredoxin domain-containing protein [Sulfurospirillum barnesii]|uniref:(2Fe-2S) ferredoxin domain-containing protein n=1 Tax=Sulfurospirillum barnesii TaxID=44674 RepID=UPI0002F258C6|nr:(2Fe-2S) ferredoxin domain-containing protein [Sulfurospirillum barnesii]
MANKRINTMGSEVVEGFTCKPTKLDPNKPIMFFKSHLFICNAQRCQTASAGENLVETLRQLLQELGLHQGENRIKISKTECFGACRFRHVAVLYQNSFHTHNPCNNTLWLKNIHRYSLEQWKALFLALSSDTPLCEKTYPRIPMSPYNA